MAKPAPTPTAGPIRRPQPKAPPPPPPRQPPRRHCTVSTGVAASALLSASEPDNGAADAEPASNGTPTAITAAARHLDDVLMAIISTDVRCPRGLRTKRNAAYADG